MKEELTTVGGYGYYKDADNVITFQMGEDPVAFGARPLASTNEDVPMWLSVQGYQICSRGSNNRKCEEIASDINRNRLLPRLLTKQVNMLYGHGLAVYKRELIDGKFQRKWTDCPEITDWLNSWQERGIETSAEEFAKAIITNYYYFHDYFVKWRFSLGKNRGFLPVAGLEAMENKDCRLATTKKDAATTVVSYKDFRQIAVGIWDGGVSPFSIYPKFNINDVANYRFAAISHHREKAVNNFYGVNQTHEGTKEYLRGANDTATYINSFLRNSLAAKIHIVIPDAWIKSKQAQITKLCEENKKRKKEGKPNIVYAGIELGTEYRESYLIEFIQTELRKLSSYLSGANNQGKAYASISFRNSQGEEERWKIETVDLRYKEYIDALISYDKRADEVLLSSVGLDPSISCVSKEGVISKSGSDVYYNYMIYILQLTSEDEICSEPFNQAIAVNFPALYKEGYRIGYYREVPARQEEVSPANRLNQQQS